jgi:hypothetical protein
MGQLPKQWTNGLKMRETWLTPDNLHLMDKSYVKN